MSVREYIGARYVPLFDGDWDNTKTYEPLTIVTYQGSSYTSRQYVPTGIAISNTDYWVCTGNYNAQIEAYRSEVQTLENKFPIASSDIANSAVTTAKIASSAVTTAKIEDGAVTTAKIVDNAITTSKIQNGTIINDDIHDDTIQNGKLANALTEMIVIGDSWSTTGYDATESELWWNLFAVKDGLTPHNYAVSGQGYSHGTVKFTDQIDLAIADTSFNHSKVKYVFIFGSLNDKTNYNNDETSTLNTIVATAQKAMTNFPSAKIVCIGPQNPINCDALITRMTQTMRTNLDYLGCLFIPMTWVTCGITWATNPDRLYHPTVNGQKHIFSFIYNWLYGIPMLRDRSFNYVPSTVSNCTISSAFIEIKNNQLHLKVVGHSDTSTNGHFNFANDVLKGLDFYNSPIIGINTSNATTFLSIDATQATFHDATNYGSNNYYDAVIMELI